VKKWQVVLVVIVLFITGYGYRQYDQQHPDLTETEVQQIAGDYATERGGNPDWEWKINTVTYEGKNRWLVHMVSGSYLDGSPHPPEAMELRIDDKNEVVTESQTCCG